MANVNPFEAVHVLGLKKDGDKAPRGRMAIVTAVEIDGDFYVLGAPTLEGLRPMVEKLTGYPCKDEDCGAGVWVRAAHAVTQPIGGSES